MANPPGAAPLRLATVLALAFAPPLAAQSVTGRVVTAPGAVGVPGALVSLMDGAGATVAAAVTGADGAFDLTAPGPAAYRIQGEAPGLTTAETQVDVSATGAEVVLRSTPRALDLPASRVKADGDCRIQEADAARIVAAWNEAAKALAAAQWMEQSGLMRLESATWYREMEPRRLRVTEESRTPRAGFHPTARHPSPPAAVLARDGFVQGGGLGESLAFHGPDPATLLDPVFAATHCRGFEPKGPEEGWVGLTFAPRDGDARDVEGTLWVDGTTGAPARLEFRYTSLPWPVKTDKVGGGLELSRLAGGPWIVHRWWLRMPRVGLREERITQWAEPTRRYTLTAVVEEGGEITRVRLADGTIHEILP